MFVLHTRVIKAYCKRTHHPLQIFPECAKACKSDLTSVFLSEASPGLVFPGWCPLMLYAMTTNRRYALKNSTKRKASSDMHYTLKTARVIRDGRVDGGGSTVGCSI